MIKNRYISALFKAILGICSFAGIFIQCGFFFGEITFSSLKYYTMLSNLLVGIYFCIAAVYAYLGKKAPAPRFKGALIMGITVTGLVYHFMLSDSMFGMGGAYAAANILLHYVSPVMSVLDWLLFDEKGAYKPLFPILWTSLPDLYFVLATVYGFTLGSAYPFYGGARFPYPFMDYDKLGTGNVLLMVFGLNAAFIGLGYVFYLTDRLMAKTGKKQIKK